MNDRERIFKEFEELKKIKLDIDKRAKEFHDNCQRCNKQIIRNIGISVGITWVVLTVLSKIIK